MRREVLLGVFVLFAAGAIPAAAQGVGSTSAQTPAATAARKPAAPTVDRRRWEIEAHLSWGFADPASGGKGALPPAGEAFQTAGGSITRRVTSWCFGDGAVLLNDVLKSLGRGERITPLDDVLKAASAQQTTGDGFGVRVTYRWKPRLTIETAFEYSPATYTVTSAATAGLRTTSDTFVTAFGGLASSGQGAAMLDPQITSAFSSANGTGADLFMTGALVLEPKSTRRLRPYLIAGGGIAVATGHAEATLKGHYRFRLPSSAQIDETDAVTIQFAGGSGFIILAGGGLKFRLWRQLGVQGDGRLLMIENHLNTLVATHPSVVSSVPADALWSNLSPGIQFSNNASTGHVSNLSAPALSQFKALAGSGLASRFSLSVGGYVRF